MYMCLFLGHTPSTAGTFQKKIRKKSGKTPETLSERFLEFLLRVQLGCPKPYNSRHLRRVEHFQNSLPPSAAGDASFFRSGSGEGLSESVMEFPAVLRAFLIFICICAFFLPDTNCFSLIPLSMLFFPKQAWLSRTKCSFCVFLPFSALFWPKKGSVPLF